MAACASCGQATVGKSKYCGVHKEVARQVWLDRVREGEEARAEKQTELGRVFGAAEVAGVAAAEACVPVPMVVSEHENQFDDSSAVKQQWFVGEGVCGFAWVTIFPGGCAAANWAKKHLGAKRGYYGGMEVWVSRFGQSMTRKEAFAGAFAAVLRDNGIEAYPGSRMD